MDKLKIGSLFETGGYVALALASGVILVTWIARVPFLSSGDVVVLVFALAVLLLHVSHTWRGHDEEETARKDGSKEHTATRTE